MSYVDHWSAPYGRRLIYTYLRIISVHVGANSILVSCAVQQSSQHRHLKHIALEIFIVAVILRQALTKP